MNAPARLRYLQAAAARRRIAMGAACAGPPALGLLAVAATAGGVRIAGALAMVLGIAFAVYAIRLRRHTGAVWLARRLDAQVPAMEDSADLLFRATATLAPLEALQQARLLARLDPVQAQVLPPWPRRGVLAGAAIAVLFALMALAWPRVRATIDTEIAGSSPPSVAGATHLVDAVVAIEPPAYTALPARAEHALDFKAPQAARLHWRVRFDPVPTEAALVFHDGRRVALRRSGGEWLADAALQESALYRIVLAGAPPLADQGLHRIDAIADRAPDIRVQQPERSPLLLEPGQKGQEIAFEASDDYGIAHAELSLTLAQGSGENIAFKERVIPVEGEDIDGPRRRRYRHVLDLAALGLGAGDEVVVRIIVVDNRAPAPNTTRSASIVLRWPAESSRDSAGMEGVVQRTMPAYFRSQRQIVIDTEALIADRAALDAAKLLARSDAIGVDQKILRLRYGQFLGEESESHAEAATGAATSPGQVDALAAAHAAQERAPSATARFGQEGDTVAEYGHVHDIAEAATLLDPSTKEVLRAALDAMWRAELPLRQGRPQDALAPEHEALDLIKRVQQSTRIYLERVGLELPPVDETRRLTGERKGVGDRTGSLTATARHDGAIAALWRALASDDVAPDWNAAEAWLRANAARTPDALGVFAALDRARRAPGCEDCRNRLRAQLWALLDRPPAVVRPRPVPDAPGRLYLDRIRTAAEPAR